MTRWRRNFFVILAGQSVSDFSSSLLSFAIIWKPAQVAGSPMVLSLALMAEFLPSVVISPFAGVFIYSRKAVMIVSDAFIALTCAALAISGSIESAPEGLIIL